MHGVRRALRTAALLAAGALALAGCTGLGAKPPQTEGRACSIMMGAFQSMEALANPDEAQKVVEDRAHAEKQLTSMEDAVRHAAAQVSQKTVKRAAGKALDAATTYVEQLKAMSNDQTPVDSLQIASDLQAYQRGLESFIAVCSK